jgi:hypothetical protein
MVVFRHQQVFPRTESEAGAGRLKDRPRLGKDIVERPPHSNEDDRRLQLLTKARRWRNRTAFRIPNSRSIAERTPWRPGSEFLVGPGGQAR